MPSLSEIIERRASMLERARQMRANPTEAERALWNLLRGKRLGDFKWKRQDIIDDRYIADFICYEARLIVEADGSQHADSKQDVRRDAYLKAQGFRIVRFWNNDILTNLQGVGDAILSALPIPDTANNSPFSLPPSPARGEGHSKDLYEQL